MEYEYNDESLKRHGVSYLDVGEVMDKRNMTTREFDKPLGPDDRLRIMFVGYNFAGRLLEIAIESCTNIRINKWKKKLIENVP